MTPEPGDSATPEPRRLPTDAETAALASDVRLRIIRLTSLEPLTNKELAERLGKDPATTLHHVRRLVDTGFLEVLPARRGPRGSRERPYRSTGLSWQLIFEPTVHGGRIAEAVFRAYLGEVADVGVTALQQTRLVLQLGPERAAEFRRRIHALLREYAAGPSEPAGERIALYLALYPESNSFGHVGATCDDEPTAGAGAGDEQTEGETT